MSDDIVEASENNSSKDPLDEQVDAFVTECGTNLVLAEAFYDQTLLVAGSTDVVRMELKFRESFTEGNEEEWRVAEGRLGRAQSYLGTLEATVDLKKGPGNNNYNAASNRATMLVEKVQDKFLNERSVAEHGSINDPSLVDVGERTSNYLMPKIVPLLRK